MMLGENELARVREIAERTAKELLGREVVTTEKTIECIAYSHRRKILLDMLEAYKGSLDHSLKKFIDLLIERHRIAYIYHKQDEFYRVRHNILVLCYLVSEPMTKRDICSRLSIKASAYDRNLERGLMN